MMSVPQHRRGIGKIRPEDLYSLEAYARIRPQFRDGVIAHKRNRRISIGPNATLTFEDRLTMQYQIQEMLRVERIFEAEGIADELRAYNPLIPDGSNWKATLMLEYPNVEERRRELSQLKGIEALVWVRVSGREPVFAVADEDIERTSDSKTSAVHFLRFELSAPMVDAVLGGADVAMGVDHDHYRHSIDPIPRAVRDSLAGDLVDD